MLFISCHQMDQVPSTTFPEESALNRDLACLNEPPAVEFHARIHQQGRIFEAILQCDNQRCPAFIMHETGFAHWSSYPRGWQVASSTGIQSSREDKELGVAVGCGKKYSGGISVCRTCMEGKRPVFHLSSRRSTNNYRVNLVEVTNLSERKGFQSELLITVKKGFNTTM